MGRHTASISAVVLTDPDRINRLTRIAAVFTPSHPVRDVAVFAGREVQQDRLTRAILEPGRHAVVYGARGVGKTSLANVVDHSFTPAGGASAEATRVTIRVPCGREDDFGSLWRRFLTQVTVLPISGAETIVATVGLGAERSELDAAKSILDAPDFLTPAIVERLLRHAHRTVVVFDEFDSIADDDCRQEFAELMKMMSDSGESPTVVLVGIGRDISALIGHHESVQRCTEQIEMPPMTVEETEDLVRRGFGALELEVTQEAINAVVEFSRGFPAFAHSLCKQAATTVTDGGRATVEGDDIFLGAATAIDGLPYSLGTAYDQAVDRRHPRDQTETTLIAAAWLAPGRLRPTAIRELLTEWDVDISLVAVTNHLRRLASPERGGILIQHGSTRPSFEFADPMMIPYVAIRNLDRYPPS